MNAKREMSFLLAAPERTLLRWMAARLPGWVTPNHLTGLGVFAALGTAAGYTLSALQPAWLWLASAMIALNWFGDSLDGTLARVRKIERPKYGYYLDHAVDGFNTAVIGVGIGLSPYITLELALVVVILYLLLSINIYLESQVFGVFDMGYGIFGPTEVRIILILANTALLVGPGVAGAAPETVRRTANYVLVVLAVLMFLTLAIRFGKNLTRLARLEPRKR